MTDKIPLADLIACAERELAMRVHSYPRFVETHRLTAAQAEHEKRMQKGILELLQWLERNADDLRDYIHERREARRRHPEREANLDRTGEPLP